MTRKEADLTSVASELESIKRLMVLLLRKIGTSQSEIGSVLEMTQSGVSRAFPSGKTNRAQVEVATNGQ